PQNYRRSFHQLLKEKRIPDDMPFYISIPSATDANLAPEGDTTMFVLVPMPLLSESKMESMNWEKVVPEVKNRVLERVNESGIHLTANRIRFEQVYTPAEWQRQFGLYDGSAFGAAHTLFQVGPLRAPNYTNEFQGLYYVGASTTPGTGM